MDFSKVILKTWLNRSEFFLTMFHDNNSGENHRHIKYCCIFNI